MKYDIGLITKYVLEFDAGIPKSLALGVSVITCGAVLLLLVLKPDNPTLVRRVSWWMFLVYLLMMLCFTILSVPFVLQELRALHSTPACDSSSFQGLVRLKCPEATTDYRQKRKSRSDYRL